MGILRTLHISGSALLAQRLRMDVIANNVANMNTTRTAAGGPYRHQSVQFVEERAGTPFRDILGRAADTSGAGGVRVGAVVEDNLPPRRVHDPQHPDADADGYVLMPNIDIVSEMTDIVSARRAYEASVTVLNATKAMALRALDIGRR
jgi:flagellar basal-body rod protein FlgC